MFNTLCAEYHFGDQVIKTVYYPDCFVEDIIRDFIFFEDKCEEKGFDIDQKFFYLGVSSEDE